MRKLLIGLGVTKSGTTWLHWALSQHPQVGSIPRKEIHYFLRQYGGTDRLTDTGRFHQLAVLARQSGRVLSPSLGRAEPVDKADLGSPWDAQAARLWKPDGKNATFYADRFVPSLNWYRDRYLPGPVNDLWYRGLFDAIPADKWCLDFSTTSYQVSEAGFRSMAEFAEDSRALLILRDPIDRLWSHMKFHAELTHAMPLLHVWDAPQLRAFAAEHDLPAKSLYADAVERMIWSFPDHRRRIVTFDDIRRDPAGVFRAVQEFLDLDPIPLPGQPGNDIRRAVSDPLPLPRGLFAHVADQYVADLERLRAKGLDFVAPWIAHAKAHARERPKFHAWGTRQYLRRAINKVRRQVADSGPPAISD